MIILFKYCVDVKNSKSFRGFGFVKKKKDNNEFEFKLDQLER